MSKTVVRGLFYTFDRSAAGERRELGGIISEVKAQLLVKNGGDAYTLYKEDAYRLASACFPGRPILDSPGHDSAYFSHYHPGGVHPKYEPGHSKAKNGPGHIFFGDRDESWKTGTASAFRHSG